MLNEMKQLILRPRPDVGKACGRAGEHEVGASAARGRLAAARVFVRAPLLADSGRMIVAA